MMNDRLFQLEACYFRYKRLFAVDAPQFSKLEDRVFYNLLINELGSHFLRIDDDRNYDRNYEQLEHDSEPAWSELLDLLKVSIIIDS